MKKNQKKKNKVKFAFFGTPELAAVFLDQLEHAGLLPSLVITVPDARQGRGLTAKPPATKLWAETRHISVLQPEVLDERLALELRSHKFDVFIVIYYGKVLPKNILDIPARGTLNTHFSLLPRWRGTSPVRAAIAGDDRNVGTSIILLDEKIDHGPVVAQKHIRTSEWPPSAREFERQATLESARLLVEILPSWLNGDIEAREQNHDVSTYCPKFEKEDGLLDLSENGYKNLLKIRAFDTTIGTYTFFDRSGKKIRVQILDAHLESGKLIIDRVKPAGKREMGYEEFLRSGVKPI